MKPLVIGTRGSPLAQAQVAIVRGLLTKAHPPLVIETQVIKTSGDQFGDLSLAAGGGKGLFTKEVEDQLLDGAIDLAVHSLKDLPTTLPAGLMIGAVPPREDARDVLVAKPPTTLAGLPVGAHIATSSIRRRAQLLARRPDLQVHEIRGNVGTRLRKLAESDTLTALILAAAGLRRLGLWQSSDRLLAVDEMIPAVGQGAIGIEVRAADHATRELLAAINDATTAACVTAERAFLHAIGGGCQLPFAAHAQINGGALRLLAARFSPDGTDQRITEVRGAPADAESLGAQAAAHIQ